MTRNGNREWGVGPSAHGGHPPARRLRSVRQAGVSVVEMVVVLSISMIMTAATVPSIRSTWQNLQLNAVAATASWAIQSARYQAVMHGYPYQVAFSTSGPSYQLASKPPGATSFSNEGGVIPLGTVSGITISQATTMQFKPNGAITATVGSLTFTVTYAGATRTITVSANGNISVT
jgi:Tfp pilus assembly protein FimT